MLFNTENSLAFILMLTAVFSVLKVESITAQSIGISPIHANKIEKLVPGREKLKKYHKYFRRDSIKQVKQLERKWDAQMDSMRQVIVVKERIAKGKLKKLKNRIASKGDELIASTNRPKRFNNFAIEGDAVEKFSSSFVEFSRKLSAYYSSLDSARVPDLHLLHLSDLQKQLTLPVTPDISDSKIPQELPLNSNGVVQGAESLQEKAVNTISDNNAVRGLTEQFPSGELKEYSGDFEKYKGEYGGYLQNTDSLPGALQKKGTDFVTREAGKRIEGISEVESLKNSTQPIDQLKGQTQGYKAQVEQYTDSAYIKEQAKIKAQAMAMEYLNQHPELLKSVQSKISALMRVYSVIPNSNDLSTAIKRTSLKGRTFKERLVFAGNFQIQTISPLMIDFAPMAGYRFNSKFTVGVGGTYRQTFTDSVKTFAPKVFGYKTFASYDLAKSFFAYSEFANNSPGVEKIEGRSKRIWTPAFMAGVGRTMTLHPKVEMTIIVAYNFLWKPRDPIYPKPLMVKVGFQTSQIAMRNKFKR